MKKLVVIPAGIALLVSLTAAVSAEPTYLTASDYRNGILFGVEHPLDQPGTRIKSATSKSALIPQSEPEIDAQFTSASVWMTGVNWGGETFNSSLGKGQDFFGSNIPNDQVIPVQIQFSDTQTTLCQTFRRDLGYSSGGVGTFPGSAWDVSDTANPRRLNLCIVEDAGQGTVNLQWDPNSNSLGKREYLFVMNSDYDGTGLTYAGYNISSGADTMDVLYGWWPRVVPGSILLETLPATLDIGVYFVKNFRGIPDTNRIIVTWNWFDVDPNSFDIYSGPDPESLGFLHSTPGGDRSYIHTGLSNGADYYYRVEANDGASRTIIGESPIIEVTAQSVSANMSLLGFWHERSRYGDIWGYTDTATGNEYALICARDEGVSIIDIDVDPPQEVGFIPSLQPNRDAKDVKIYENYAVVLKENEPIQMVDISDVTNPVTVGTFIPDGNGAHNCLVEGDYLYVVGNHGTGGLEIVDISNPAAPVEVGQFQPFYYHDLDIRNDTVCAAGIYGDGIDLIDVVNKTAPSFISRFNYTGSGAHNIEYSFDGNYVFEGDEIGSSGNHTRVWNISDPFDVSLASEIIVDPSAVVHNCYVMQDTLLVLGHYTEGVRIWNVVDPTLPYEVAHYDTYLPADYGYRGCWSVYPSFSSGRIVASDMQTGLYVLEPNFAAPPSCCVNRGNIDAVIGAGGPIDVADLSYLVDYLFRSGPPPPCDEEGNVDSVVGAGGPIDVADLSYLVDYLFRAGPVPPPCP